MTTKSTKGALKTEPMRSTGLMIGTHKNPIFKALSDLHTELCEGRSLAQVAGNEFNIPHLFALVATIENKFEGLIHSVDHLEFTIKKHLPKEAMPSQAN